MTPIEIHHTASAADQQTVAAIRAQSAPFKGMMTGPEARPGYDAMIAAIPAATSVSHVEGRVGGIPGLWCQVPGAPADAALLYLHGGAYVLGSATAYKSFASQFAARTGVHVFVADYGLAPERPFPAGLNDARAVWRGLQAQGIQRIVIVGDSAGGGLSLSLLNWASSEAAEGRTLAPVACVVMSPWTDLALTGSSYASKSEEDPFVTEAMLRTCAAMYLGTTDPKTAQASPVYGDLAGLPPIQMHVGTREILLDDTLNYAARVQAAGGQVAAHVWQDMPHVFPSSFNVLEAGEAAMQSMAKFIRDGLANNVRSSLTQS
jgi:epsilon-lactone hydrolase